MTTKTMFMDVKRGFDEMNLDDRKNLNGDPPNDDGDAMMFDGDEPDYDTERAKSHKSRDFLDTIDFSELLQTAHRSQGPIRRKYEVSSSESPAVMIQMIRQRLTRAFEENEWDLLYDTYEEYEDELNMMHSFCVSKSFEVRSLQTWWLKYTVWIRVPVPREGESVQKFYVQLFPFPTPGTTTTPGMTYCKRCGNPVCSGFSTI
jgi:hypothetical protein